MVDAKDLRIGNWVWVAYPIDISLETYTAGKEIAQIISINRNNTVDLIGIEYPKTSWVNFSAPEPIPLTTEILEKCGFDVRDDNPKQKEHYKGDVLFEMCSFEFTNSMTDGFVCYDINEGKTVYKYLHQLQNLYWCLTGTELNINL